MTYEYDIIHYIIRRQELDSEFTSVTGLFLQFFLLGEKSGFLDFDGAEKK